MSAFANTLHTGLGNNGIEVSLNYITGIPNPDHLLCSNTLKLAFKSLLKRDVHTKQKSIISLLEYIKENSSELDNDLVIITWIQMYPKLAIDDSSKVRSCSHQIQSQFVLSLGKKYAKYLRDTIGIWLAGLFDTDRATARTCRESICDSFGNNEEKVTNLWKIFITQIVQYSHEVIVCESKDTLSDDKFSTKEEIESKYIRVTQASISLLVNALSHSDNIDINEKGISMITQIYNNDSFLDLFGYKDLNLKKAVFMASKALITSKHLPSIMDKALYKKLCKALIKGIKLDSSVNALLYGPVLVNMLDTLVVVTSYNSEFWLNVRNAKSKLLDLLKVGSLNSEPIYYDVVAKLLKILPNELVSITNSETIEPFILTLIQSVEKEKSTAFLEKGWKVVINLVESLQSAGSLTDSIVDTFTAALVKLMDSPRIIARGIIALMHDINSLSSENKDVLLDINSIIMDHLPDKQIEFNDSHYLVKHQSQFIESFVNLLLLNGSDLADVLLANAIESLGEYDPKSSNPTLAFITINVFIKNGREEFASAINEFIRTVSKYISKTFKDLPLETLKLFTSSIYSEKDLNVSVVNSIFTRLKDLDAADELLPVIASLKNFSIHNSKQLNMYLLENSKCVSSNGGNSSDTLYTFLNSEILSNLFRNENFVSFADNCVKNYQNDVFLSFSIENSDFVEKLLDTILQSDGTKETEYQCASSLLAKLEQNIDNIQFRKAYLECVINCIERYDGRPEAVSTRLSNNLKLELLNANFDTQFEECLTTNPNKLLSISNSLNLGMYYFVDKYDSNSDIDLEQAKLSLNKATFYASLIGTAEISAENLMVLLLISEYASDILFLEYSYTSQYQEKLMDFQVAVKATFSKLFSSVSYTEVVSSLATGQSDITLLQCLLNLLQSTNRLKAYYTHRIIKLLLEEKIESMGMKSFELLPINDLENKPTILYALLNSANHFLTVSCLDHVRNKTIANLISIRKSEEIVSDGLKDLILLNSFMDIDDDVDIPESFCMAPPQRFMILLGTFEYWMDSDVAYEENFKPLRIALMQFVQNYIKSIYYVCDSKYPTDFITKVFKLGLRLVSENINLVNSDDQVSIDVLFHSLHLLLLLSKYKQDIEDWEDEISDIETETIELFFKVSRVEQVNLPLISLCEQFSLVLLSFNNNSLNSHYGKLFDLMNSKNINIQRTAASLLHQIIPDNQDQLVVEFLLSKKKANEEGVSDVHLPNSLLQHVRVPLIDYIEYEEPWKVYQYLWSWYLIMDHFKNITQQMRQDYISELTESTLIEFLNFAFSELETNKFRLHEDEGNYVKNYSFDDNAELNYQEEIQKLLVNLVYEIMNNIGGTFAQNWFQSIKDKQFQQRVEKFITRFISPQLIGDILSTLANKNSVEDSEFKININKRFNEIKCLYHIDEQKMEISIVLPANYPLAQIAVNGISRIGVDEKKWKSWIMSAQYVINFQNGSILDAIKHFKDNVSANFENYEDCAICYSILNAVDHSTPNKVCPTCKHNFHSACLYRWFKSSGASTCPLCRSKFNFKKHS